MFRNDQATLITITAAGSVLSETRTTLFCGKKSVRYGEFYAATQVGINPKILLEFDLGDYENAYVTTNDGTQEPTELEFRGQRYNIIRTYEPDNYTIEVTAGK